MTMKLLINAKKMLKVSAIVLIGAVAISASGSSNAMMRSDEHPDPGDVVAPRLEELEVNRVGTVLDLNDLGVGAVNMVALPEIVVAPGRTIDELLAEAHRDLEQRMAEVHRDFERALDGILVEAHRDLERALDEILAETRIELVDIDLDNDNIDLIGDRRFLEMGLGLKIDR